MTKPTEIKNAEAGRPSSAPPQEEMEKAYQVHTLAQMLYGQMAGSQPWVTQPTVQAGFPSMQSAQPMGVPGWTTVWGVSPWGISQTPIMTPFMAPELGPFPR
jgi:hypothetical protein